MKFHFYCSCGERVTVGEGAAGTSVPCTCGAVVAIPSLREMHRQTGKEPLAPSPELVVSALLGSGEIPGSDECVRCGGRTENIVHVVVECEQAFRTGGFDWGTFLLTLFLLPIKVMRWKEDQVHGEDKAFTLPLRLCPPCRMPPPRKDLKELLGRVPEYRKLLDKYPKAKVHLLEP